MGSLWREVASASWVANTAIPLLFTIIAIMIGFGLFRRQLQHDRMLLTAQNRAQAARELAAAILRAEAGASKSEALDIVSAVALAVPVLEAPPARTPVKLKHIADTAMEIAALTRLAERAAEVEDITLRDDPVLSHAVYRSAKPYRAHLLDIAASLMQWDGVGDLPAEPPWPNDDAPRPGSPSLGAWLDVQRDQSRQIHLAAGLVDAEGAPAKP